MSTFVMLESHLVSSLATISAGSSIDTGLSNAEALLYKIGGVVLLVIGVGIMWSSRRGQFGKVLGQVGIIVIGLFVVLLGVGGMAAGTAVGTDVLAFFGLS